MRTECVGTKLLQSPIRDWISFSSERSYPGLEVNGPIRFLLFASSTRSAVERMASFWGSTSTRVGLPNKETLSSGYGRSRCTQNLALNWPGAMAALGTKGGWRPSPKPRRVHQKEQLIGGAMPHNTGHSTQDAGRPDKGTRMGKPHRLVPKHLRGKLFKNRQRHDAGEGLSTEWG